MKNWVLAAFIVIGFIFLVRGFGLIEKSKRVASLAQRSLEIFRSNSLCDNDKEAALQHSAIQLLKEFFIIALCGTIALSIPLGLIWLGDYFGLISQKAVFDVTVSPTFLIISFAFSILVFYPGKNLSSETTGYSIVDRLLHRVAFHTYLSQIQVSDLEDLFFAKQLAFCEIDRPVFITSLPRAGTTLLLECFAPLHGFASHCYRDMPFVLTPCLWNSFSTLFRQNVKPRERAHGDGMIVDVNSPEALEEVVWKTFWPKHYHNDRIIPWQNEENDEFDEFFSKHMRKIILLRRGKDAPEVRYISKNNLNIARCQMLHQRFPDSVIIVPFREPLHHAASLLEQHLNFLRIHEEDSFASEYMKGIGHFDFGKKLCPIDFDGWLDRRTSKETENLAFWLEYWLASYSHLINKNSNILHFFNYQRLCEDSVYSLRVLGEILKIKKYTSEELLSAAPKIRPARFRTVDTSSVPAPLLLEVNELYSKLKEFAVN